MRTTVPASSGPRLKILVVEDDLGDRKLVHRALRGLDAAIHDAGRIAEAERALRDDRFDCAIVDWHLPDGDAEGLLRAATRGETTLPVVVLTGRDDVADQVLHAGGQDYLVKGQFDAQNLTRAVHYAIERQRASELQRRLMHAERLASVGTLAAGVAHEVSSPATVVLMNLQLLADGLRGLPPGAGSGDLLELVEESRGAMQRISSLVRQLGGFSKPEPRNPEPVSLERVVRDAVALAKPSLRHRAEIEIVIVAGATLLVDRAAMTGVVVNLLVNAQQAIDGRDAEQHRIRVSLRDAGRDGVLLMVEDTGPGVPEGLRKPIFEPFFTHAKATGTGLGLSICREVVAAHGGTISVSDSSLGGAAFSLHLPRETGLVRRGTTPTPSPPVDDLRILVVDDHPGLRRAMARMLRAHAVTTAATTAEAFGLLRDGRFDVVLCDLMMPGETGGEFYERVTAQHPDLADRFVFVTGGGVTPETQAFLAQCTAPVVPKPCREEDLEAAIQRVVGGGH